MPSETARTESKYIQRKKPKPLTIKVIDMTFDLLGFLFMAWLVSVVIEWLGMSFIWTEEGAAHSERMLRLELSYLQLDFTKMLLGTSPAVAALDTATTVRFYLFEWTGIESFYHWLLEVPADASNLRISIGKVAWSFQEYFQAMINTTLTFAARITVATLTLPGFLLVGLAALADGLVQRELRIYGGGIERAMAYHHAKPWIKPALLSTWFFYLGIPFSVHPNYIFVPAMAVWGISIFLTAALFKKHL